MSKKDFRTEKDSMGELQVPAGCKMGRPDTTGSRKLPNQRLNDAAAIHCCARAGEMGRGGFATRS